MEKFKIFTFTCLLIITISNSIDSAAVVSTPSSIPRPTITPQERQFGAVYEWNVIDYAFANQTVKKNAIANGEYIPENNIISDVKPYANRLFLTLPRMLPGVPITLGWVISPDHNGRTDPEVEPFPSWEMNKVGNCTAFQFVQGIEIDADGIMWVVDSGKVDTLINGAYNGTGCPPKITLIDLKRNGTIIMNHIFDNDVVSHGGSLLNKVVVDDAFGGFAYITDDSATDPGIVVYSRRLNFSWKIRDKKSMSASPDALNFTINGYSFPLSIHIDGIALGPYYSSPITGDANERNVYYCPMSSYHLYSIPASILRDQEFAANATPEKIAEYVTDYGTKSSQSDGMIMDNHGILYFSVLNHNAIAMWDSFTPFTPENQHIIAEDQYHIQWTDGMGFDEDGHIYVVVNKLHKFVARKLDFSRVNFRVLKSQTKTLNYVHTGRFGHLPPQGAAVLSAESLINTTEAEFDPTTTTMMDYSTSSTMPSNERTTMEVVFENITFIEASTVTSVAISRTLQDMANSSSSLRGTEEKLALMILFSIIFMVVRG